MLQFSVFEVDIFFIKKEQKIEGMRYGVVRLDKGQLKGIVECIDLSAAAYPIPRNLRERLENKLLPRFYEIKDAIDADASLPNDLGVEVSKLNQEDILYGLNSKSISKQLSDRGFNSGELQSQIVSISFDKL